MKDFIELFRGLEAQRLLALCAIAIILMVSVVAPVPAYAQSTAVSAEQPPGNTGSAVTSAVGWIRWIFGPIAVVLLIVGFISIAKHPAAGVFELMAAVACIILAGNASSLANAIYGTGSS